MSTELKATSDADMISVLRSSLYPGAAKESVQLVLEYCRAAKLDPMQKPVHIVPMWDSKSGGMRDVIMPGIGLYRTQAARSGALAGVSEPEFGPETTENVGGTTVSYPAWCRVSVSRELPSGKIAVFFATERWIENYATKGGKEKSIAPNAMWLKRPYGQLAKCAQAQAFRVGFPEIGSMPTAEEMEGKEVDNPPAPIINKDAPQALPPHPADSFDKKKDAWMASVMSSDRTAENLIGILETRYTLSNEQKSEINGWTK